MPSQRIDEFNGLRQDVHRSKLPDGGFQTDEGGDHYKLGSWKVRRGRAHSTIAKLTTAPWASLVFELSGGDYATVLVEGQTIHGFLNVGQQSDS